MKAIARRIRRLEDRFVPKDDPAERRLVELLRERRRRRYEAEGKTYVPPPPMDTRGLSIAEILRGHEIAPGRTRLRTVPVSPANRYCSLRSL